MPGFVKPPWPVWQPGHTLGNGLRAFFAVAEPADVATTRDAVAGLTLIARGGAKTGQGGLVCDAVGKGFESTAPASLRLALPITIACQVRFLGAADNNAGIFGLTSNNSDGSPFYAAAFNSRSLMLTLVWSSGSSFQFVASAISPASRAGLTDVLVGVLTPKSRVLYLNGEVIASATGTYLGPTYGPTALVAAGNYTGVSRNSNCVVEGGAVWNRDLSPGEVLALTGDFFAPVRHRSSLALWAALAGDSPAPFVGSPAAIMLSGF